jgi:predicted Na+-dependent transporter
MTLPDPNALSSIAARALTAGYLVISMLSMGLEVGAEPKADKAHKRKQRRLLVRALVINLVLLPIATVVIIRALHTPGDIALALVLLAAAPGGRLTPHLTRIAGGDLGLSVEITLFLAKLTMFTGPLLVRRLLGVERIELHDLKLIAELALLQVAPYFLGRLMRRRWVDLAGKLIRPVHALEWASVAAIVGFLVVNRQIRSLLLLGGSGWLALCSVAALSLALGWLLGGSSPASRRAIALSVSLRNLPLALVMAGLAFAGRGVESLVFAVWLVLSLFGLGFALVARRQGEVVGTPPTVGLGLEG